MALVFFVRKKDGKKCIVQNYRYLNKWTVKNNYCLSLILDIVENIGTKKVFTKMDLRQEYNNVWKKDDDEQKAMFTIPEESFELTVIFFRLMNSSATFQTIMNEILQNLINTGKVESFIDDIIVEMETEKGHDEIVEEVVKRLVENSLYVKPEKYKQRVRKVGFLKVVIELKGIKMEEEKVKSVLDQPTPEGVKDIQKFLGLVNYYHWFIKNFTVIARLLHNMIKKNQKWEWMEKQKKAFRKLKEKFTKELVLVASDLDKKNIDGSGCIRLCYERSIIYGV